MGALDFTVGTDSSGHIVPGDVKIFMKNLTVRPVLNGSVAQCVHAHFKFYDAILSVCLKVQRDG